MARILQLCTSEVSMPHLERLLRHQDQSGHEVHLAYHHDRPSRIPGVTQHRLPFSREISPHKDARALVACMRLLRRLQPDLVHAHNPKAGLLGMMAATAAASPRRVYHVHGLPYFSLRDRHRTLLLNTERVACQLAHRVICVSPSVREALVADCGVPREKISILGNGSAQGIDTEAYRREVLAESASVFRVRLGLAPGDPLVLFLGRFHPEKGLDILTKAWPMVLAQVPRAHLLLVGKPDEATPCDVSQLAELPHVHVHAYREDPRPAYSAAQLHILPSLREGLPTSVLEAAAMEVPSLVSDTLGCVDAVQPGVTGVIVPGPEPDVWARAIAELLENDSKRRAMGSAARRWVLERFQPGPILSDLDRCYSEMGIHQP